MKTTIELPDDLFRSVKQKALHQNTSMKVLIERALRREIYPLPESSEPAVYEVDMNGIPTLKPQGKPVTADFVYKLMDASDLEG